MVSVGRYKKYKSKLDERGTDWKATDKDRSGCMFDTNGREKSEEGVCNIL
jgi:hypothetical protein